MKTLIELQTEFGDRLVTLKNGQAGLRVSLKTEQFKTGTAADGRSVYYFRASDATIDRYNETIDPTGWDVEDFRANPVITDCHNYSSIAFAIGTAEVIETTPKELILGITYSKANPLGRLAEGLVLEKTIRTGSVGFIPKEGRRGKGGDEPDYYFQKQSLLEFAQTVVPANQNALRLALKSGAIQRADLKDAYDYLKQFCGDEKQTPDATGGASGAGVHDARFLQMARSLCRVIAK